MYMYITFMDVTDDLLSQSSTRHGLGLLRSKGSRLEQRRQKAHDLRPNSGEFARSKQLVSRLKMLSRDVSRLKRGEQSRICG